MKKEIEQFTEDCPQFDDITMMCFHYKGAEDSAEKDICASITLPAADESIPRVTELAEEKMQAAGVPRKVQMQMDIAIDGERRVVELTFRDRGIPYNPLAKTDPDVTSPAEDREAGGVGIYIVKQSMDEMFYEYRDGQNILRIRKKFETCTEK